MLDQGKNIGMDAQQFYWEALARYQKLARRVDKSLKPFYIPLQQSQNQGIYAVNIDANVGFFAQLSWCLYIFDHCKRNNLKPCIALSGPFYSPIQGEDWFGNYFHILKLTESDKNSIASGRVRVSQISDIDQLGWPKNAGSELTLEYAKTLFEDNLQIKSDIVDCVEIFQKNNFKGKKVLGVHFRGTDKKHEAAQASREFCAQTISNYLASNPGTDVLFIATDEEEFLVWIKAKFSHIEVVHHDDKERSQEGMAIHTQPSHGNNYIKGKEALINSLLLSKCEALIRTASFLSAWSSIFNPDLRVVMLNRPYEGKDWFPDNLIIKKSINGYLPG